MIVETTKNIKKYESYKYAFERLEAAINQEFFLEAITIAESVISDRILSYLVKKLQHSQVTDKLPNTKKSLGYLIIEWKKVDQKAPYKEREDLINDVNKWRDLRNEFLHGLVKSDPGNATKPVDEFVNQARDCALHGKNLARDVCSWTQSKKTKADNEFSRGN